MIIVNFVLFQSDNNKLISPQTRTALWISLIASAVNFFMGVAYGIHNYECKCLSNEEEFREIRYCIKYSKFNIRKNTKSIAKELKERFGHNVFRNLYIDVTALNFF